MTREAQDLLASVISTLLLILIIFFFKNQHSKVMLALEHRNVLGCSVEKIKFDNEKIIKDWIIMCQKNLKLESSEFNTEIDRIFYRTYPFLENRSLSAFDDQDYLYRIDWYKIAIKYLSGNSNFCKNCPVPNQILG